MATAPLHGLDERSDKLGMPLLLSPQQSPGLARHAPPLHPAEIVNSQALAVPVELHALLRHPARSICHVLDCRDRAILEGKLE